MSDCLFCKIIAGQIPCTRVFEDAAVLSFLDIGPISPGHTLLVPKKHYGAIGEMPADEVAALFRPVAALAAAVQAAVGAEGINVLQNNGPSAGQVVPHLHIHLIPLARRRPGFPLARQEGRPRRPCPAGRDHQGRPEDQVTR